MDRANSGISRFCCRLLPSNPVTTLGANALFFVTMQPLKNQILLGDCLEVLKTLPSNSYDALITDPPAGISFMGRHWDKDAGGVIHWVNWMSEILAEALRVLKPGACGVVWSIPRTCGWTQLALELAGFRVVDSIAILTGEGFPKGTDISKQIYKLHGCDREVVGIRLRPDGTTRDPKKGGTPGSSLHGSTDGILNTNGSMGVVTNPASDDAKKWEGWKSPALKPTHETWFLVQKPCEGTIARNVLKWGTGGINIEACRIGAESTLRPNGKTAIWDSKGVKTVEIGGSNSGRYPANTILICSPDCSEEEHADHCPVSILGEQSGVKRSGGQTLKAASNVNRNTYQGAWKRLKQTNFHPGDIGTVARYFKNVEFDPDTFRYFTKAPKSDQIGRAHV